MLAEPVQWTRSSDTWSSSLWLHPILMGWESWDGQGKAGWVFRKFIQLPRSPDKIWVLCCDNSVIKYIRRGFCFILFYLSNIPAFTDEDTEAQGWHWPTHPWYKSYWFTYSGTFQVFLWTSALSDFPTPDTFAAQRVSVLGFLLRILKGNLSYSSLEVLYFLHAQPERRNFSVQSDVEGERLSKTPGISMLPTLSFLWPWLINDGILRPHFYRSHQFRISDNCDRGQIEV